MGAQQLAELQRAPARRTATSAGSCRQMLDAGIATRRGIMCSHREPAYRDQTQRHSLPHSEAAQDRTHHPAALSRR